MSTWNPFDPSLYDYDLPSELIAQRPVERRDSSRLLRLKAPSGEISHHRFRDLAEFLRPGDLLVLNDTQVVPARLTGRKKTGGRVEILLLEIPLGPSGPDPLLCLGRGARTRPGEKLIFDNDLSGVVEAVLNLGQCLVAFQAPAGGLLNWLARHGRVPLPPYIKRDQPPAADSAEARQYQTVYAASPGAVAAPTAGLHFTPDLLSAIAGRGVEMVRVTLHVGYGTFEPLREHHLKERRLHPERFSLTAQAAQSIAQARRAGRRVVAVGTTTVRLLEHLARIGELAGAGQAAVEGQTDLFIAPGFEFQVVRAMVTNFHLPRTSLMMLVSALAGRENILAAYREAVALEYRFYSFGDAMFIEADRGR